LNLLYCALVFAGTAALLCALWAVARIQRMLPNTRLVKAWHVLSGFILLFICSYFFYLIVLCKTCKTADVVAVPEMFIPVVFFTGGVFVLIVCELFSTTAEKLVQFNRLESESITDPLTGTYNRRHMQYCLEGQAAFARRNKTPLTLLLIDLDHFKAVNDTYGHLCGDNILCQVADSISAVAKRDIDMVFRYGGEEFLLMLPQTPLLGAATVAESIRSKIAQAPFKMECNGHAVEVRCGVSIGVGQYKPESEDIMHCLERADSKLYLAKEQGRNRVVW